MLAHYDAAAAIRGGEDYPEITGTVGFCKGNGGTWVDAVIDGLPPFQAATETTPQIGPHGFHIHEGGDCGGTAFSDAEGHWTRTISRTEITRAIFRCCFPTTARRGCFSLPTAFCRRTSSGKLLSFTPRRTMTKPSRPAAPVCGSPAALSLRPTASRKMPEFRLFRRVRIAPFRLTARTAPKQILDKQGLLHL